MIFNKKKPHQEVEKYSGTGTPKIAHRSDPFSQGDVTDDEVAWMQKNYSYCPDCGGRLLAGPEGGGSQNCPCTNPHCLSEFNCCGFIVERNGKMSAGRCEFYGIKMPKIAISTFASGRHVKGKGYSYFDGSDDDLVQLTLTFWNRRSPGFGRNNLEQVVIVPVHPERFVGVTATLNDGMILASDITRRQPKEDPYVSTVCERQFTIVEVKTKDSEVDKLISAIKPVPDPVLFAKVVCYSAATLLENDGKRSSDADWEIVAIIASAVDEEPMHPLAMARNFLQKEGGTFAPYTAQQFAEAIYYWSTRVSVKS